jgi:DNA-binding MarR family transcriptional regulator
MSNDLVSSPPGVPVRREELFEALDRELRAFNADAAMVSQVIAERLGIGPTDLQCVNILGREGPIPAGRLAELTGLATPTITGVVDRLEKAGFVARERDKGDRRRVIVQPLPEVWRRISPLFGSLRRASAEMYSHYSDEELALILDFVTRSRPMLREETAKLRGEVKKAG